MDRLRLADPKAHHLVTEECKQYECHEKEQKFQVIHFAISQKSQRPSKAGAHSEPSKADRSIDVTFRQRCVFSEGQMKCHQLKWRFCSAMA
jgi:hypothetical protein